MSTLRVLVIDDDQGYIRQARASLARLAEVRSITSGADGLRSAAGWLPDVILLDLLIDDTDSFALLDDLLRLDVERPPFVLCHSGGVREPRFSPAGWPVGVLPRSTEAAELRAVVGQAQRRRAC